MDSPTREAVLGRSNQPNFTRGFQIDTDHAEKYTCPVTPDPTPAETAQQNKIPSTQGMTTRVVKGSIWVVLGQFLPLSVSFLATPFVIKQLGADGYGVIVLIALIPTYLAFADFGMGMASTKFASGVYAEGDPEKEGRVIRTAALIAFLTSLPIFSALIIFAPFAIALFNVPENFVADAVVALRIASVTFVVTLLSGIYNSPQLSRLRMDLNVFITAGFRSLGIVATPIIIYFGGGIVGATIGILIANLLTLFAHLIVSGRLLPELINFSIERAVVRPMLKFGGGLVISGIAGVLLLNFEKLALVRVTSVETLAYYTVAYTFAVMAAILSSSMVQSLVPAFSQLLSVEKRVQLEILFSSTIRLNMIGLFPMLAFLFIIARPFFTIWGGPEFGEESTLPFQILLFGIFFTTFAFVPYSLVMSYGRTDLLAKAYWLLLFPYIGLTILLTMKLGVVGAAVAWSFRATADAIMVGWLARHVSGISYDFLKNKLVTTSLAIALLFPPVALAIISQDFSYWALLLLLVSSGLYSLVAWKHLLDSDERTWVQQTMLKFIKRQRSNL